MRIGYSKTYPIVGKEQWEKIWIEDEVTGTEEDARKALYSLKKQVENFHYESNKAAEKVATELKIVDTPQSTEARIIAQIYGCSDLKVLESFKLLSNNNKAVKAAYEQQEKKLLNKE